MKGRNLPLAVPALLLAMACENPQQPDRLAAPHDPSHLISDGAHGGNPDFFFLPPMVASPDNDPNYEVGAFNATLGPSLTVEICELQTAPVNAEGLPVVTDCVAGPPLKKFAAGTIRLASPPDEFYQVLWHTGESALDVTRYYRIKVLVEGASEPFGVADVDPVLNMKELRNARTGEVIPLNDDATLPIKFRIEHGGGPALCGSATLCTSTTVTNTSSSGVQSVVVDAGGGSIAGASFPNGWLPDGGPQSVVVTIAEVNVGPTTGGDPIVCHPGLPFQQFKGCFNYTTTPRLQPINQALDQFALPVTVAVCFELEGTGDPREKFAELYASGPNEPPHALDDVPDGGLLGVTTRDCSAEPVIVQSSNRLMQLASTGWRTLKGGLGQVFGVKTAYAVDLGLGGIVKGFSNISPVVTAQLSAQGPTDLGTQPAGTALTLNVMVTGSNHHADHAIEGIGGVPVTFSVASTSQGTVAPHLTAVGTVTPTSVESITSNNVETRGQASAIWNLPAAPGTYTLTVTAPATGSPQTFTATVPPTISLSVLNSSWVNEDQINGGITSLHIEPAGSGVSVEAWGNCSPWDCPWGAATASTTNWNSAQQIVAVWDQGYATRTQTITYLSPTRLQVVTFTDFTVADGRTDYTLTEYFQRPQLALIGRGWVNENTATPGITRVNVTVDGSAVSVQAWGKCDPVDCDWGVTTANTSGWTTNHQIVAFWDQGFATRTQTITFLAVDYVKVVTFTDFTDADGRTDYTLTEYFRVDT